MDEFDPRSDEEIEETADESVLCFKGKIGSSAYFLLDARSGTGRFIRFNNCLLY